MKSLEISWAGSILATLALACAPAPREGPGASPADVAARPIDPPTQGLLVLIVVDQFRGDYLDRYAGLWRGGIADLLESGVVVEGSRLIHAISATAPGHATLATGVHPAHHAIIDNQWIDSASSREVESIDDDDDGVSPRRMLAMTLADRIKDLSPSSRVYGISGKDRGAVLLAGHQADGAYWYNDDTGNMVSSRYYHQAKPTWLASFNSEHHPSERFGAPWSAALLPSADAMAALGVSPLDLGPLLLSGLPKPLGGSSLGPGPGFYGAVYGSPVLDEQVAALAKTVVETEGLGTRDVLDVLTVSFSAVDVVGHRWGIDSPEHLDTILRVDLVIGDLLADLEQRVGADRLVVGFSSDHGVLPTPEATARRADSLRRISGDGILCIQGLDEALDGRWGEQNWLRADETFDPRAVAAAGTTREEVERVAMSHLAACPGVAAVWSKRELLQQPAATRADDPRSLWSHSVHPERGPDLEIQFEEGFLATRAVASNHGSIWSYDREVPMIFLAPGLAPGRLSGLDAATIDFAPTLARLVGVSLPGSDGRPLELPRQ